MEDSYRTFNSCVLAALDHLDKAVNLLIHAENLAPNDRLTTVMSHSVVALARISTYLRSQLGPTSAELAHDL